MQRNKVTNADMSQILTELSEYFPHHLQEYGDGTFVHPHELVGCSFGQLLKLSAQADETVYSQDTTEFEKRCMKAAVPLLFAIASVRVNRKAEGG